LSLAGVEDDRMGGHPESLAAGAVRRRVLQGAAVAGLLGLIPGAAAADAPFATLRARWATMQTGAGEYDPTDPTFRAHIGGSDAEVSRWREAMTASPPPGGAVWRDAMAGEEVVNTRVSFDRLRRLAIAYGTPGSRNEGDPALLADIAAALRFLSRERYNPAVEERGNWWEWRIGAPLALLDTLIVLDGRLEPALVEALVKATAWFTPEPAMTAANRVWTAQIVGLRALIIGDGAALTAARRAVETTFADVAAGDGFHRDGSFVQHDKFAYTGGYGLSLLQRSADLVYLLHGSDYAFETSAWSPLRTRVHHAFAPLMYRGAMMDMVLGRGISRDYGQGPTLGRQVAMAVAQLAAVAPEPDATAFRGLVKHWVTADSQAPLDVYDPTVKMTAHSLAKLHAILTGPYAPRGDQPANIQFPAMDRIVHKRAGFALGIAQSSREIANYESVNRENLRGWYTGSGATYLYVGSADAFARDFWPTADMRRVPGVTADHRPLDEAAYAGTFGEEIVGGASAGTNGVACMAFSAYGGELTGRKAWFMFGDRVLCAGAGIRSRSDHPVETVIDNRNVGAAGDAAPAVRRGVGWTHVAGVGGYVVADGALQALRETRSGAWRDINDRDSSPTDRRTRRYVTLWLDHGVAPQAATYAYTLLPGASARACARYARSPEVVLIANKPQVQHAASADVMGAVFWECASSAGLSCNAAACVVVERVGDLMTIGVSDPTGRRAEPIRVRAPLVATGVVSADAGLAVSVGAEAVDLTLDPRGTSGEARRAEVRIDARQAQPLFARRQAQLDMATWAKSTASGRVSA
jgi:hyaluronate lyase